jgi:hypothetical protein
MQGGKLIKQERVAALAIATVVSLALLLSASAALAGSVPRAKCGPADHTESGLQGQTTPLERSSGDSERAYNCNLELVFQFRGEGAVSQDGPTYFHQCAYFATNNNPQQQHPGVVVVDVSDPENPTPSTSIDDTLAMADPHETLRVHVGRKLLAAAGSAQGFPSRIG